MKLPQTPQEWLFAIIQLAIIGILIIAVGHAGADWMGGRNPDRWKLLIAVGVIAVGLGWWRSKKKK